MIKAKILKLKLSDESYQWSEGSRASCSFDATERWEWNACIYRSWKLREKKRKNFTAASSNW